MTETPTPTHRIRGKKSAFWASLIFVFFLALLPRLVHPVSRPMQWYERSVRFWDALLAGDLGGTYQRSHPGVTTMWVAGLGLRVYAATHGWSGDELLHPPATPSGVQHYPIEAGVAALSIFISLGICIAYVLLVRLLGWRVGIAGGCLLALDPFYIAHSKVLHVDAMLATLMLVSALLLVNYLREKRRLYLILSGGLAGLAFLTKSPSIFLLPYAALILAFFHLADRIRPSLKSSEEHAWSRQLGGFARDLVLWGLVAASVFVLLWPAMWVEPGKSLAGIAERLLFHAETPHKNANFFAGQIVYDDPGWPYYAATLAWKTTLVTLPASCGAIVFLLRRWKQARDDEPAWWMLICAGAFFVMVTLAAKKMLRYLLPTFPALDVLAAWGLVQMASSIGRWRRLQNSAWVSVTIIAAALVVQAGAALRHHPYYGTHHNLLLGGSRVAQHILPLGDEGEGLDLAARFLNDYPGAERRSAGLQQRSFRQFDRYFAGHTRNMWEPDLDYWIFTINFSQRELNAGNWDEHWEICQQTAPLETISFDGVPYVWICRAYPHDPAAFAIEHRLDARLGDHISLLGYRLSSSEISAGETLTVTLFWQSDGRLVEDYHVFVHLLDAEGELVAQHDSTPEQGKWPTWEWRDTEVIEDEHALVTNANLAGGAYTLFVGMYDSLTQVRLPVLADVAGAEMRVVELGSVRVER